MKVIVCTNARDEGHIVEWVSHYLNLGFDHVYIFDHRSLIPVGSLLRPNPRITVERCDYDHLHLKVHFMNTALKYAADNGYDWMFYIDCDEFLYLKTAANIQRFLEPYGGVDQVGVNWLVFGNNYKVDDDGDTMLSQYTRSERTLGEHIKSFVRPARAKSAFNPHVFIMHPGAKSLYCEGKPYGEKEPYFNHTTVPYAEVPAYLAHYYNQAYTVYVQRKVALPRDDVTTNYRDCNTLEFINAQHNDIVNTSLCDKYNAANLELMKTL